MLRPLSLLPVRKQQHQPARLPPLRFRRHQELVDDHLRAIGEIAELRFPQHQRQRIGHAVAELETHHREFRQRTVVHLEARLTGRQVRQRHVHAVAFVIVILDVTLAERAASAVLSAQPHRRPFEHQAPERQHLRQRPVDPRFARLERLATLAQESRQFRMDVKILRKRRNPLDNVFERFAAPRPAERCREESPPPESRSAPAIRTVLCSPARGRRFHTGACAAPRGKFLASSAEINPSCASVSAY